ncbi:MAG: hypothetical protein KDG89_05885 [Geminicoccaceae bacterium]|nr:hypothetical protein [Geminicoccaceae bacterium]
MPDAEDARELAALRADLLRRRPVETPVERHRLERLAACHLRQEKLEAIEFLAMDAFLFDADEPDAPEGKPRLPSLATLLRYRKRIARDLEETGRNLHTLIDGRLCRADDTDDTDDTDEPDAWEDEAGEEANGWEADEDGTDEPEAGEAAPWADGGEPVMAGMNLAAGVDPRTRRRVP